MKLSLVLLAGLLAVSTLSAAPPNIIVILADDLGYSDLGCYGGEIPTPNLDRLAKSGARFEKTYTSARCCPTRASLITGLHPHEAGIGDFVTAKPSPKRGPAYTGRLLDNNITTLLCFALAMTNLGLLPLLNTNSTSATINTLINLETFIL